jgi:small subunit ribosomal protein S2
LWGNSLCIKMKEEKKTTKKTEQYLPDLKEMLKAGIHFGHRTSKWNPKMEQYIFTSRNNVHMLDLEKSRQKLGEALAFISEVKEKKGVILFVGAKVSAKEIVKRTAEECGMPYANERWLGGTLTNFEGIAKRLEYFRNLEKKKQTGELAKYTKKEQHEFSVELSRLNQRFGGIKNMLKLPDALLVIDVKKERGAVKEANMKGIPVIGVCDTNSDPDGIDYLIPANDDAISSLKLILETIAKVLKE